jgi:hypothetical protein
LIWLASLLQRWLIPPGREPDFVIGDHYMDRWFLIPRNKLFNIYLHHIRHSDDDRALHDHPWWSLSLCIDGWMTEVTPGPTHPQQLRRRLVEMGDVVFRSGTFAHRLEIADGATGAWTLFITGPVSRTWGFYCPQGWKPWYDYVAKGRKGQVGVGCGEME